MDKWKYLKYFRGLYWNFTFLRPLLAGIYDTIFPSAMKFSGLGYTIWFVKNLGLKNFLKNKHWILTRSKSKKSWIETNDMIQGISSLMVVHYINLEKNKSLTQTYVYYLIYLFPKWQCYIGKNSNENFKIRKNCESVNSNTNALFSIKC